ncbi:MAG: phosphotransferase [Candidatus Eisenbacteria bacterium]|nr:phosphotransferase [Candidatus Eisenbacteria bacterium]
MISFESIEDNFKFILLETQGIVQATRDFVDAPSPDSYDGVIGRDDYIDNLKNVIENQCYRRIHTGQAVSEEEVQQIRAIQIIAVNLERIADNCVNIARQVGYLEDPGFIRSYDYAVLFEKVLASLTDIYPTFREHTLSGALAICKIEYELDRLYKETFDIIMPRLRTGQSVQNLITTLFIFRYLERMGDALLNVGEALIFAIIGQRIKVHQFQALQESLDKAGFNGSLSRLNFEPIWGTRSGCRISRVGDVPGGEGRPQEIIFKEGNLAKIRAERESLERWERLFSGLAPRVISYHEERHTASLLEEFLPGYTLDEIAVGTDRGRAERALTELKGTLRRVWSETRRAGPIATDYVGQIEKRLHHVRNVHPHFSRSEQYLGGSKVMSSRELLSRAEAAERKLPAPFSVLTHGDLNANNVVYNEEKGRIHFIDLHRSRHGDYVQDVSVFLISNCRMPLFEAEARTRLHKVIEELLSFAAGLAREWEDGTFGARMATALARSLYTSTRFELNPGFSKEMYLRAHFLLEKVVAHHESEAPWGSFTLPSEVLYY